MNMSSKKELDILLKSNKLYQVFEILSILFNSSLDKEYEFHIKKKYKRTLVLKLKYQNLLEKENIQKIAYIKESLFLIINELPYDFFRKFDEFEKLKLKKFSDSIDPKPTEANKTEYKKEEIKKEIVVVKNNISEKDVRFENLRIIKENRIANQQQIKVFAIDFIVKSFFLFLYYLFGFNIIVLLLLQITPSLISYFILYNNNMGVNFEGMSNINKLLTISYLILYSVFVFFVFKALFCSVVAFIMYFRIFLTMEFYINFNEQEFFNPYNKKYKFLV